MRRWRSFIEKVPQLHSDLVIVEAAGLLQAHHPLPESILTRPESHPAGGGVIRRGFPVLTGGIEKVSDEH